MRTKNKDQTRPKQGPNEERMLFEVSRLTQGGISESYYRLQRKWVSEITIAPEKCCLTVFNWHNSSDTSRSQTWNHIFGTSSEVLTPFWIQDHWHYSGTTSGTFPRCSGLGSTASTGSVLTSSLKLLTSSLNPLLFFIQVHHHINIAGNII